MTFLFLALSFASAAMAAMSAASAGVGIGRGEAKEKKGAMFLLRILVVTFSTGSIALAYAAGNMGAQP